MYNASERIATAAPAAVPERQTRHATARKACRRPDETEGDNAVPMNKPHLEFHKVDMNHGWATPTGYPAGIQQKILASDLDENRKMGGRTRLLRFAPGVYTTAPFVHDHWEEVYLLSGDLVVGNDDKGNGGEPFDAPTYACRPPGVHHGPFKSEHGCMLYEIHYYDESKT
jgi:hypothetical protein